MKKLLCVVSAIPLLLLAFANGGCAAKGNAPIRNELAKQRLALHLNGLQSYALADGGYTNNEIRVIKKLSRAETIQIDTWLNKEVGAVQDKPTFSGFWLILFGNKSGQAKVLKVNRGNGSFWIYALEATRDEAHLGELQERLETICSPELQRWLTNNAASQKKARSADGVFDELERKF